MALALSRNVGEEILIGDDIVIKVVALNNRRVRLSFEAPQEIQIHRREVYEAIQKKERESGNENQEIKPKESSLKAAINRQRDRRADRKDDAAEERNMG